MAHLTLSQFQTDLLQPFDLEVKGGECFTLSGPSGCGKSKLFRAIADLDPHQGSLYLDNRCSTEIAPPLWRQQVGLLPAESGWWGDIVGEHFTSPTPAYLTALGFTPSVLQWPVERLSSGERQRLALARLLNNQPQVLLLDEPTANLDAENTLIMERIITDYHRTHNCATLWISHSLEQQQRIGQQHLIIDDGRVRWS